ncbi:MptD family putative ECF transporter S component [Tepidibacter hydrothermalis]|uniref:MptD family putative ECF transporter S component n=1 Tax=Tepidibacter hydrothermalis TaxID=3036126 RepID=A0ABY8EKQ5_9FIRM|nr:MptD family putative ECF transporter S component [Tepidibacter hydrothermalis]WFD11850.1 MptD family putative ECF transporter S component [Tepidibacter hydrothermalis]
METKSKRLTVKDFATVGIFCAIMIVVFIAFSMVTGASLFFNMVLNAVFTALILAPFFVYMSMKVGKPGIAFIYNAIQAIMATLFMGPFMIPWFLGGGILSELVMLGDNSYRDIKRIAMAWTITSLTRAMHGMSEIWFFKDAFIKSGVSPEQVAIQTQYYTSPKWVLISCGLTIVAAIIGCRLGNKMIEKHFRKIGVINK